MTDPAAFEATLGRTYGAEVLGTDDRHPLAGIVLQRALESRAFELGGGTYEAPGQLVVERGGHIAGIDIGWATCAGSASAADERNWLSKNLRTGPRTH